jgi:hypothetical protein
MAKQNTVTAETKTVEKKQKKQVDEKVPEKTNKKLVEEKVNTKDVEEAVSKKSTKKSTKEPTLNRDTIRSGCSFNVNQMKRWLKSFYSQYSLPVKVKYVKHDKEESTKKSKKEKKVDEQEKSTTSKIKIRNAHMIMVALEQTLALYIVNTAYSKVKKTKESAGLYEITEQQLMDSVRADYCLRYACSRYWDEYRTNAGTSYVNDFGVSKELFCNYIEKNAFSGGNTNVKLTDQAYSYIAFLIVRHRMHMASGALGNIECAQKSTIEERSLLTQLKYNIMHVDGQGTHEKLQSILYKKAEETIGLIVETAKSKKEDKTISKKEKKEKKESKDDDDEEDEDDEASESESESEAEESDNE